MVLVLDSKSLEEGQIIGLSGRVSEAVGWLLASLGV